MIHQETWQWSCVSFGTRGFEWICHHKEVTDFSSEVIPQFIGRIVIWRNEGIHIDIGSIQALREAQTLASQRCRILDNIDDEWIKDLHRIRYTSRLGCAVLK